MSFEIDPYYGWGWTGNTDAPHPPRPFCADLRLERGAILGAVRDRGHELDGYQFEIEKRHVDGAGSHYTIHLTGADATNHRAGYVCLPRDARDALGRMWADQNRAAITAHNERLEHTSRYLRRELP